MNIGTLYTKAHRKILQLIYGFDKWHTSPLQERPYAKDIINYCNARDTKNSFAEIGCGLGDIIRNVNYGKRDGFDNDGKVLKAAAVLPVNYGNKTNVEFHVFSFPESSLQGTYDVLAMVNWIHHIEPVILKKYIQLYLKENINTGGEILIDTVQDKAYRYNHQIEFLTGGIDCSVYKIGDYARQREVFAIKK